MQNLLHLVNSFFRVACICLATEPLTKNLAENRTPQGLASLRSVTLTARKGAILGGLSQPRKRFFEDSLLYRMEGRGTALHMPGAARLTM